MRVARLGTRAVFGVLLCAIVLVACAPPRDPAPGDVRNDSLDVQDAKQIALADLDTLIGLIPAEVVSEVSLPETGVLVNCDTENPDRSMRGVTWHGTARVVLVPGADLNAMMNEMAAAVAEDPDDFHSYATRPNDQGDMRLITLSTRGTSIITSRDVNPDRPAETLLIGPSSPCFGFPPDDTTVGWY